MTENKTILIKDAKILNGSINKGSILIENDKIKEVNPNISVNDTDKVINAENKIVLPGLINTHSHLAMTLLRGVGDDLKLDTWLNDYIWPKEAKLTDELCYIGSKLAIAEMIKTGTTCYNDMYFHMDQTAKATKETGIRGLISYGMIDLFDEEKKKKELNISKKLIKDYHNSSDGRLQVALGPHSPYTCSQELLEETVKLANKYNIKTHIHVAETQKEVDDLKKERNQTPFEYLNEIGILGENTIAAHGVWATDNDIQIIKKTKTSISHNPSSNMKLASGIAPIKEYLENGINVCIGTDGCASNNNLDMFKEMKLTTLLQKVHNYNPEVLTAQETLNMATINGAKALGINAGRIDENYKADLILVDNNTINMTPDNNSLSNIIYASIATNTDSVICNGEILLENKELTTINEKELMEDTEVIAKELQ
ncbi:MAG: amidohydrolase family protein [Methanobacteriaceae archaeon]|nr:amidohydrolase family protein [Methanobacteriaceae archaeon]